MEISCTSTKRMPIIELSKHKLNNELIYIILLKKALNILSQVFYEEHQDLSCRKDDQLDRKYFHVDIGYLSVNRERIFEIISKSRNYWAVLSASKYGYNSCGCWFLKEHDRLLFDRIRERLNQEMIEIIKEQAKKPYNSWCRLFAKCAEMDASPAHWRYGCLSTIETIAEIAIYGLLNKSRSAFLALDQFLCQN